MEISDLLKNFLFSKHKEIIDFDIEETWQKITENSGNSILRMLRFFWISRKGSVSQRDLYRNIRTYAQDLGVARFVEELESYSEFYSAYFSKDRLAFIDWLKEEGFVRKQTYFDEISRSTGALKLFGIAQIVPLVYSSLVCYLNEDKKKRKPKAYLTFLRFLEAYHFINNKVCNRVGNEVEKIYAEYCVEFIESDNFSETMGGLKTRLLDRMADKDEFVASFSNISYENRVEHYIIRYIFDRIENLGVKAGAQKLFVNYYSVNNKIQSVYDIEHLHSQSKSKDEDDNDYIHEMGNLLILPKQINGILGDDDFSLKMKKLDKPWNYDNNIKHVDDYIKKFVQQNVKKKKWSRLDVEKRTRNLAEQSYEIATKRFVYK